MQQAIQPAKWQRYKELMVNSAVSKRGIKELYNDFHTRIATTASIMSILFRFDSFGRCISCIWRPVGVCVNVFCVLEMLRSSDLDWCNTCFRFIRICFHESTLFRSLFFLLLYYFDLNGMKCIYFSIFWCIIFRPFSILRCNFKYARTISNEFYR